MQAKNAKKNKSSNKTVIIVGCCIIAVALAFVLGVIFIPPLIQEGDMEDFLESLAAENTQSATLIDPLPDGGNVLTGSAVQIELKDEELETVRNGLHALAESGVDVVGEIRQRNFNDLLLRVRDADGKLLQLHLSSGKVYYYPDGNVEGLAFVPEDAAAYADFYSCLEAMVSQK